MKKSLSFLLAMIMVLSVFTTLFSVSVSAADGGEGNLSITSPSDNGEVNGDEDIKIKWSRVSGADHYHLTIKDTVTGEKPFDEHVSGTSKTIKANTVFLVEGRTYKIYACAMDENDNVLNRGSDWEAIYVTVASNEPKLVYASPALTSPSVDVKYDAKAYCYYGTYDGEIDSSRDLTIKWEDVYSDYCSFTAVVLKGDPDHGSTSEKKLHEIVIQKKRTSCKYTIDKDDLEGYEGKWLKVVIQPMANDGDYGLMSMFYLKIANPDTPDQDTPPVVEEPTTSADDIYLNGVDIGFNDGDYFTKNGKACSCHNKGICLVDESQCNCIRYVTYEGKTVDLAAVQCFGFSRFCQLVAFGEHDGDSDNFTKTFTNVKAVDTTELKNALLGCAPGTHVRTRSSEKGYAHSITVVSTTNSSVTIVDCNHSARCQISQRTYTWAELASFFNGYGGVDYISVYDASKDTVEDVTPPVVETPIISGDQVTILIDSAAAKPGETVQIPVRIKATGEGISYLRAQIQSDLRYTLVNDSRFSMTEGSTSVIWYANQNVSGTVTLAYIEVTIPTNAPDSACYSITVTPVEANNFNEETVKCSGGEGTITVEKTLLGDCNGDGTISGKDLTRMLRYLADYDNSTGISSVDIDHAVADLNGDSVIDGKDITRLLKILAD